MDDDIFSIIVEIIIVVIAIFVVVFSLRGREGTGTNMNNETKNYVKIHEGRYQTYGITEDGTREFLKSYKFEK